MTRERVIAIGLLKQGSAGKVVGSAARSLASGGSRLVKAVAREGAEAAEELGAPKVIGGALALAGLGGTAYVVGREGKRRTDPFRYRHGLYLTPSNSY